MEHFTSVGIKLANKIHSSANFFRKFLPKYALPTFFLEPKCYDNLSQNEKINV